MYASGVYSRPARLTPAADGLSYGFPLPDGQYGRIPKAMVYGTLSEAAK
jgi:hypothetical protein